MKTKSDSDPKAPHGQGAALSFLYVPRVPSVRTANPTSIYLCNPLISRHCTVSHVNKENFSCSTHASSIHRPPPTNRPSPGVSPGFQLRSPQKLQIRPIRHRHRHPHRRRNPNRARISRICTKNTWFRKPHLEKIVVVISILLRRFSFEVTFSSPTPLRPLLRDHARPFAASSIDLKILCNLPPSISQDLCV
jgi:hypothetical protein